MISRLKKSASNSFAFYVDAHLNSVQLKRWSAVIIYRLVMETCLSAFSTAKVALLSGIIPPALLTAYFGYSLPLQVDSSDD